MWISRSMPLKKIAPMGVDLIDCSSGPVDPAQKIAVKPGYQVPFSQQIRTSTGIMTGAVGLIEVPTMAARCCARTRRTW